MEPEKPKDFGKAPLMESDLPKGELPMWVEAKQAMGDEIVVPVPVADEDDTNIGVEINTKQTRSIRARRFLELVEDGMTPSNAAKRLHSNLRNMNHNTDIRTGLRELVDNARFPAEIRKEMVRAGLNSIFLRNVAGKLKEQKIALDAARQIAKDPEVGLNAITAGPSVNIDLSTLGTLLEKMKPIAGLESVLEAEKSKEDDK